MVMAEEQILAGSAIAYEKGIPYYASVSQHLDQEKQPDGVTFAITSKPGVKLPEKVSKWGKELAEQYRIDETTTDVFVNPNGQMIVAGGFKNPNFKIPNETVGSMSEKIASLFTEKEIEKSNETHDFSEVIEVLSSRMTETITKTFAEFAKDMKQEKDKEEQNKEE